MKNDKPDPKYFNAHVEVVNALATGIKGLVLTVEPDADEKRKDELTANYLAFVAFNLCGPFVKDHDQINTPELVMAFVENKLLSEGDEVLANLVNSKKPEDRILVSNLATICNTSADCARDRVLQPELYPEF